jgi:hypothetical protein
VSAPEGISVKPNRRRANHHLQRSNNRCPPVRKRCGDRVRAGNAMGTSGVAYQTKAGDLANRRLQPLGHLSELVFFNDLGSRAGRIWTLLPNCYPPVESRPIDRRVGVAVVGCQHVGVDRRQAPARAFARRYRAPPPFRGRGVGATSGMSGQLQRVRSYQQQKPG